MAYVVPEARSIVLKVRNLDRFTSVFPKYKSIPLEEGHVLRLPHTIDTVRILRNMGIKTKGMSPIDHYYTWPRIKGQYEPMWHQKETARFLTENPRSFCLNQPRTGKTAATIMAMEFLRREGVIKSALVVAPLSVVRDVWESEIFGISPSTSVAILTGSKAQRLELLKGEYDVYIINPDGIKVIERELEQAVREGRIGCVAFDEVTDFANASSQRSKTASRITKFSPYVWGLTGTPGGPEPVFGIVHLVRPEMLDSGINWWRHKTMFKINNFKWVPKPNHLEEIDAVMRPSICFKKDELMDLPPLQQLDREAPLSKEQKTLFEKLRKTMVAEGITAANAAVMTSKLMQVATGAVRDDDGNVMVLDIKPRLEELLRIIDDTEQKVIVFAPYTGVLDLLHKELEPHHTSVIVDGRVSGRKRDAAFEAFRNEKDPHILLAHPRTTSFGLELSIADTIVFWGVPLNGSFVYQQAVERINSALQKSKTPAVVHLHSTELERRLFKALKDGVDINSQVLDLFKEVVKIKVT